MIESSTAGLLGAFTRRLASTYRDLTDDGGRRDRALMTLTLAETMLEEHRVWESYDDLPVHVAVVGPTQAGKSTVVNLLLGRQLAEASPLAAFTRELTGFIQCRDVREENRIRAIFGEDGVRLESAPQDDGGEAVVWDTPDFDSHLSHGYRALIARVGALADVIVLVVSKEKYADLSVWETLDALRPLGRRLVVCLNKVSSDQEVLSDAVHERLRDAGWDREGVPVIVLPHAPDGDVYGALSRTEEVSGLRRLVIDPAHRCDHNRRLRGLCALFERNWDDWLRPVVAELGAAHDWQRDVDRKLDEAMTIYEEQYLDQVSHNSAFKQAVLQLLELLEIPALAGPLSRARNVLTWPMRKLTGLFDGGGERGRGDTETEILKDVMEHALLALHAEIVRGSEDTGQAGAWWRALNRAYPGAAEQLKSAFGDQIRQYQVAFEPEIEEAARSLYERLEENPVMLNTLRASRVGADTAGVIFAIKTGTVGIADALLTPAMLSLTSMMTEGAVGQYMETVRDKLRERQRARVQEMLTLSFRGTLLDIVNNTSVAGLFRIDGLELEEAMQMRKEICG